MTKKETKTANMKTTRRLLLLGLPLFIISSCSTDETDSQDDGLVAVEFAASAGGAASAVPAPATRTTDGGDSWASGDEVGVFMVSAGGSLPGDILTVGSVPGDNRKYNVDPATGALIPDNGDKLFYPQDGSAVDFIAYYPYTGEVGGASGQISQGHIYHLNMSAQTNEATLSKLDLLYAKTTGAAKSKNGGKPRVRPCSQ